MAGSCARAIAVARELSTRIDRLDTGEATLIGIEAGRVELHAPRPQRLQLHLGLPFVDVGKALGEERLQERVGSEVDEPLLGGAKLGRPEALGAGRGDDQRAARREDIERSDHAFHRLIIGLVERRAGSRREHRGKAPPHRHPRALGDELDRGEVAGDHLAEIDVHQIAVLVDHRVERVDVAQHPHDRELLLVQRVPGKIALDRRRILHEARAVERADRVLVCDTGRDHLAAPGVAGHEMRLDQPGRDAQVGVDEPAVELDRRAAPRGNAEIDVRGMVAGEMVFDAHRVEDPRVPNELGKLCTLVGPVQPGRDEHGDALARHAGGEEAFDQRAQEQVIRHRPRDIADQDARALSAPRQLGVGRGSDRRGQRGAHRRRAGRAISAASACG